jgi:hypothetical protein
VLDRLDIRLARRHGSGQVEITLIKRGEEVPSEDSEDVVEQWLREATAPRNALEVLYLPVAIRHNAWPTRNLLAQARGMRRRLQR